MQIKHSLAALSVAAVVALSGCGGPDTQDPAAQPPGAEGEEQAVPGAEEMPEADLSDVPEVVAEVNGEDITKEEFAEVYEPQFQQAVMGQQGGGEELDEADLRTRVADQLVDNRLLTQAAEEAGITASPEEVDDVLEEIAQRNGLGSAEEVIAALEEQGLSEEEIREDASTQVTLDTYIEQEADVREPSEEELREQYDQLVEQASGEDAGGEETQIPDFEDVRDELAQQAVSQQEAEAATEIAAQLREEGDVTIHL